MDADDLELFRTAVIGTIAGRSGSALDSALAELGWLDAFDDDPRAAISVLFEAQGEACTASSSLARLMAHVLGHDGVLLLPSISSSDPPGLIDGTSIIVRGTSPTAGADRLVVVVADSSISRAVTTTADRFDFHRIGGLDPDLGLFEVSGTIASDDAVEAEWTAAVDLGRIALAHELTGVAAAMLELARTHALEREQFGQPIAGFQAVKHRLADTLIAIETARAAVDLAWDDRSSTTAAMAKAVAGRSARTAMKHCQQVLAGIGFTIEHPLHRYVRRVVSLDLTLGSSQTLTSRLGAEIIADGDLPPMLAL